MQRSWALICPPSSRTTAGQLSATIHLTWQVRYYVSHWVEAACLCGLAPVTGVKLLAHVG